jgi:hypothetical protein
MAKLYDTLHAKNRFLSHFKKHGAFYAAAAFAPRSAQCVYEWIEKDPEFELELETAKKIFIEKLEKEVDRRAIEGVAKPLYYKGRPVFDRYVIDTETGRETPAPDAKQVVEREYSDTLLMFHLKALDPARYRENSSVELSTKDNKPIESVVRVVDA